MGFSEWYTKYVEAMQVVHSEGLLSRSQVVHSEVC